MFLHNITPQQKHGIIVCQPKPNSAQTPDGYRPITLLNTGYKIFARILANRLRPILEEQLQTTQFFCVPGNSILEAVSIVRETIAHAEITDTPLCVAHWTFRTSLTGYHTNIYSKYSRAMG